jgi:hypothetical protein
MTNRPFTFPVQGVAPDQFAEVTSFSAALNRALGFAVASTQQRPGKFPDKYTSLLTGRGDSTGLAGAVVANTTYGDVWEVTGAGVVALRDRVAIEEGAVLFARYRRSENPTTGQLVTFKVDWLDSAFAKVGSTTTVRSDTLTVANGLIQVTAKVNVPTGDLSPPGGAVYVVPYIETFGTDGKTQVINVGARPVKALLAEYSDVAGVAELVEVDPASDNETYYPTFVRPATAGDRAVRVDADLNYNPNTNTLRVTNIDADTLDVDSIVLPDTFIFPQDNIPEFPVARTFYVTMDGDNTNSGTSISKPFRTIARALTAMNSAGVPCVTIVHPGDYLVPRDSVIPPNCALYGYDLRVTTLRLANAAGTAAATSDADREQNMFLMRNGIKVRGFTITGMQHEPYTFDPTTQAGAPPEKGYAFVFNPGEVLTRSPYIADSTVLHDFSQDDMSLPIDRDAGNPLIRRGCGNLYADGAILSGYSPLRSVVVDGFTAVNPNGIGYAIVRNALVQLVSVFTNWSRVGVWAHLGGQVTLANSNNTFGDYAFVASDSRTSILIPDEPLVEVYTDAATTLTTNFEAIITALMGTAPDFNDGAFAASITGWASFGAARKANTEADTRILLKELIGDLRSGQSRGAQRFVKGLFDWNGNYIWDISNTPLARFNEGFDAIQAQIDAQSIAAAAKTRTSNLINNLIKVVLADPANYRVPFVSVVEFASQAFSYSGSGVNYNALPFAQRGTAIIPEPPSTILQWGGGRCYGTYSTERGDTYLGNDLRVDFERSTVEGQAFSRGVQNIALPLIIALG